MVPPRAGSIPGFRRDRLRVSEWRRAVHHCMGFYSEQIQFQSAFVAFERSYGRGYVYNCYGTEPVSAKPWGRIGPAGRVRDRLAISWCIYGKDPFPPWGGGTRLEERRDRPFGGGRRGFGGIDNRSRRSARRALELENGALY